MAQPQFQWTQDSWEPEVTERRAASRNERLAWFGAIALAVVAFEVTADPALTVSLGCLKFGWDEVRLAWWLKRTDPDRGRGHTCSLFYLAWGACKIIVVTFFLMFLLIHVQASLEGKLGKDAPPVAPRQEFIIAEVMSILSLVLLATISTFAVISGLRNGVRVWVGPEARWAREDRIWPPHEARPGRLTNNRARIILLSALISTVGVSAIGLLIVVALVTKGKMFAEQLVMCSTLLGLVGGAILILVLLESLGRRIIALEPGECWRDLPAVHHV